MHKQLVWSKRRRDSIGFGKSSRKWVDLAELIPNMYVCIDCILDARGVLIGEQFAIGQQLACSQCTYA